MLASSIFLYRYTALRALLRFDCDCPFFKLTILKLFAGKIFMPGDEALKAECLFAVVACYLSLFWCWSFNHNIFTFGIRTEFFKVTSHNLLVSFKLSKLFICGFITDIFNKFIRDWGFTPALRAFYKKSFISWLCNLISKKITIAILTEGMTAASINNKITIVMFFIANFTKFWIHNLLWLYK